MELSESKIVYEMYYESFIAGALLVLPSIDVYDEKKLSEELKLDLRVHSDTKKIDAYINKTKNGIIVLKDGLTLDSKLENGCTLREKLSEIAGDEILRRFQGFNVQRYILNKEGMLADKQEIIDKAGVLLISRNEEAYLGLREYGFKHIDYFRSVIRADKYFKEHPNELSKYHLILTGIRGIRGCTCSRDIPLDNTIHQMEFSTDVIVESWFENSTFDDCVEYKTSLERSLRNPYTSSRISDILDIFVNYMLFKGTLKKVGYEGEFKPIKDFIADRLPLPTKKGDLKILYLDNSYIKEITSLTNKMGLNITFRHDDNSALDGIRDKLGEYDIIVVNELRSGNLLKTVVESTEQCKDTGRGLVLLATYDSGVNNGLRIKFKYTYAGNLVPKDLFGSVVVNEFDVLTDDMDEDSRMLAIAYAIISTAVHAYNKCLPTPLADLDLKSPEEYNQEYKNIREEKDRKERAEWESIHLFDKMMSILENYLNYRNRVPVERNSNGRAIIEKGNGLKIRVLENGIVLENYYHGKINFAISLPMLYRPNDYRVFSIRIGDSCFQSASLYVGEKKDQSLPPKANNYQLRVLSAFVELVEKTLLLLPLAEQQKQDSGSVKK